MIFFQELQKSAKIFIIPGGTEETAKQPEDRRQNVLRDGGHLDRRRRLLRFGELPFPGKSIHQYSV
jgi:hypothetical protein